MFGGSMVEATLNSVEIADFDEEIVAGMLEYMYTAEVDSLHDKAPDLLQIAEKYDLEGLKEECEHTIAENLTVDNAADVLVMAHLYNASILKPKVIDFINR
jgi:speckle-type POZ protein